MKFVDITGQRFGKLTVTSFSHKEKSPGGFMKYFWKCKCDCGNTTVVGKGHLTTNKIRSCGCLSHRKGNQCPSFRGYGEIPSGYFSSLKRGSKERGRNFKFSVSIKYLWHLFLKQNRKCALSGVDISFNREKFKKIQQFTASLDRIDSTKGYIEGNVQWVHKEINLMKNDFQQNKFIEWCNRIANIHHYDIITPCNEQ